MATDAVEGDNVTTLRNESSDKDNSSVVTFDEHEALGVSAGARTTIKLNFVNRSNDVNNSDVVIFARNVATDFEETAVAWTVIQNCGPGWSHPVAYPSEVAVAVSDSWGNYSPRKSAEDGQAFAVTHSTSGDVLNYVGQASNPREIDIRNDLPTGAINAMVYRDGRLYAQKTSIAPQQKAVFTFKPTIWIGVVSQVEQGEVMNAAIMSQINTEISLLGMASADIVMTGGGAGPSATPFTFTLENVVYA